MLPNMQPKERRTSWIIMRLVLFIEPLAPWNMLERYTKGKRIPKEKKNNESDIIDVKSFAIKQLSPIKNCRPNIYNFL